MREFEGYLAPVKLPRMNREGGAREGIDLLLKSTENINLVWLRLCFLSKNAYILLSIW